MSIISSNLQMQVWIWWFSSSDVGTLKRVIYKNTNVDTTTLNKINTKSSLHGSKCMVNNSKIIV